MISDSLAHTAVYCFVHHMTFEKCESSVRRLRRVGFLRELYCCLWG